MGLLTPVEQEAQKTFGMVPMEERLSILPRYSSTQGLIAPQFIYDLAKAFVSPYVAMQGRQVSPEESLNVAMSAMGGSSIGSAPKGALRSGFLRNQGNVNPAEITARKAIDDLVNQAKAYGIESPVNYSNMPVGQALADLNQYLGRSQAVANLPEPAKASLRNLFGNAESAGMAYQRVYGENKLMGKPEEAANKGILSTKSPWFSQELEDKFINKEITRKQYERQTMKNMENYFKK